MASIIPSGKRAKATLQLYDVNNNPTQFDSVPNWSSSSPEIIAVEGTDPYERYIRAVGPLGNAQVSVIGDADLGEGVREMVVLGDFTVVAGDAITGTLAVGPVED